MHLRGSELGYARLGARLCKARNTRQALRGSDGELAASDWASSSVESGSDTWLRMTQQPGDSAGHMAHAMRG